MRAGSGRAGDFAGDPLLTIAAHHLYWLDADQTTLRAVFAAEGGLPTHKFITYMEGVIEGTDVTSPQDFIVPVPGVVPNLAAVAVNANAYDAFYDPLGGANLFNLYELLAAIVRTLAGRHRVARNTAEGYAVYVGYGAMPDFTVPAVGFGSALPVSFAITPPGVGTVELWVVTRKVNKYGLTSQNTHPQKIVIDTNGDEVLGLVTGPDILGVISVEDEYFKVFAQYNGFTTDTTPADKWRLYVGTVPPVVGVDVPVVETDIGDTNVDIRVGPYITGGISYFFAVTVYRTEDGTESEAAEFELALPADPVPPTPTLGNFVIE